MHFRNISILFSASILSITAQANTLYLSAIDESIHDARYRFITSFAEENSTQLDQAQFEQTVQQQIKHIFGKNKFLNEQQFIQAHRIKTDAQFKTAREAQIRQTKIRFDAIDVNKDGFIDLHEFQKIGLRSFEMYDTNKDGFITAADDQKVEETDAQEKEGESLKPRLKGILTMPTTHNAQGFITLYAQGRDRLSLADYLKTRETQYQNTDSDQDGKISHAEYEAEFLGRVDAEIAKSKTAHQNLIKARFKAIDANQDGKISAADVLQFAQGYFAYWDTNHDGIVTLSERLPD